MGFRSCVILPFEELVVFNLILVIQELILSTIIEVEVLIQVTLVVVALVVQAWMAYLFNFFYLPSPNFSMNTVTPLDDLDSFS
jgi:hypothetical protein